MTSELVCISDGSSGVRELCWCSGQKVGLWGLQQPRRQREIIQFSVCTAGKPAALADGVGGKEAGETGGRDGSWVWEREGVTLCPNGHRPALAGERQEGKQGREGKEAWKRQRAARLKLVLTMLEKERRGPELCGHADPCLPELSSRPAAVL